MFLLCFYVYRVALSTVSSQELIRPSIACSWWLFVLGCLWVVICNLILSVSQILSAGRKVQMSSRWYWTWALVFAERVIGPVVGYTPSKHRQFLWEVHVILGEYCTHPHWSLSQHRQVPRQQEPIPLPCSYPGASDEGEILPWWCPWDGLCAGFLDPARCCVFASNAFSSQTLQSSLWLAFHSHLRACHSGKWSYWPIWTFHLLRPA